MKFLIAQVSLAWWTFFNNKKKKTKNIFLLVIFFFVGICVPIIRLAPGSILAVCLESSAKDTATFHI